MLFEMVKNFVLTVLIEGLLILVLFRRRDYVYFSFLCNLLTNPALNIFVFAFGGFFGIHYYYVYVIALEIIVVVVEAYVYNYLCGFGYKKAGLLSLLLNGVSFGVGLLLAQPL
jgi:hypothetical protein